MAHHHPLAPHMPLLCLMRAMAVNISLRLAECFLNPLVHQYSQDMIADSSAKELALFVTRGQHDIERFVNMETYNARADPGLGERIFQNVCAACHGFDGRAINFRSKDDPEYIGTVASHAPWEALHKIRNGHPGVPMPALRFLEMQTLVDILSYAQTLPQENRP
jgi:mono/diheme cytochrome c family protein